MTAMPRTGEGLLPVSVITEFLGSGKTTLLSKLLQHPATGRVWVIVDELGQIGLDHDLIRASNETLVELNSRLPLLHGPRRPRAHHTGSLHPARQGRDPDFARIVIETTDSLTRRQSSPFEASWSCARCESVGRDGALSLANQPIGFGYAMSGEVEHRALVGIAEVEIAAGDNQLVPVGDGHRHGLA